MSNSISYSRPKWDLWMVAALVSEAVVLVVEDTESHAFLREGVDLS
jgi:hypothetical protein